MINSCLKQSCVSLVVLTALMGSSVNAMDDEPKTTSPRLALEDKDSPKPRNPANLANLEGLPVEVVYTNIFERLDARSAAAFEATSFQLCQIANYVNPHAPEKSWSTVKKKIAQTEFLPQSGVAFTKLTRRVLWKQFNAAVKATDEATRASVLGTAFRLASYLKITDWDYTEVVKGIEELGPEREDIVRKAIENGLMTAKIRKNPKESKAFRVLEYIKKLEQDREEVCSILKGCVHDEMDADDVTDLIYYINDNDKSICKLTSKIVQARRLFEGVPTKLPLNQFGCGPIERPYRDIFRDIYFDIERLGEGRERIVKTALRIISEVKEKIDIPEFLKDVAELGESRDEVIDLVERQAWLLKENKQSEIIEFLREMIGLGEERVTLIELVRTNGLLTKKYTTYSDKGIIETLNAVTAVKANREVMCSIARDFVWDNMSPWDLKAYFEILETVGPDYVAIQALASSHGLLPQKPQKDSHSHSFFSSSNPKDYCNHLFLTEKALLVVKNLGENREPILTRLKDYMTPASWMPSEWSPHFSEVERAHAKFLELLGTLGEIPDSETRIALAQDCHLIKPTMRWDDVVKVVRYIAGQPAECSLRAKGHIPSEIVSADEIIDKVQEVNPIVLLSGNNRLSVKEVKPDFDLEKELKTLGENRDTICDEVKDIQFKDTWDLEDYFSSMRSLYNDFTRRKSPVPTKALAEAKSFLGFCKNSNGFGKFLRTLNGMRRSPCGAEVCQNTQELLEKYSNTVKIDLKSISDIFNKLNDLGEERRRVVSIARSLTFDWGVEHLVDLLETIQAVCKNTGELCESIFAKTNELSSQGMTKKEFIDLINEAYTALDANDDNYRLHKLYLVHKLKPLGGDKYLYINAVLYKTKAQEAQMVNILTELGDRREAALLKIKGQMKDNIENEDMTIEKFIELLEAESAV